MIAPPSSDRAREGEGRASRIVDSPMLAMAFLAEADEEQQLYANRNAEGRRVRRLDGPPLPPGVVSGV